MTTCFVGEEVGVVGPSLLEVFPFVIFAIEIYFFPNNFVLFIRLFDLHLFLSVSSSSWCLERAAVCDCGTP